MPSTQMLADSTSLRGRLAALGLPETKAGYLQSMFTPDDPTFPLDAETIAAIPRDLPGRLPTSIETLYGLT